MAVKVPWMRLVKVVLPAVWAAIGELAEAADPDSDEGKKITRAEAHDIAEAVIEALRPRLIAEIERL